MVDIQQVPYLLGLHRAMRLTYVRFEHLKIFFEGDFKRAFYADERTLAEARLDRRGLDKLLANRSSVDPDREKAQLEAHGIRLLLLGEEDYPPYLEGVYDPPPLLFTKGCFVPEDFPSIAVVGSRRVSSYGKRATEALVEVLAKAGVTITSGLAFGVDYIAHKIALEHGTRTIAVLGSGVDRIYPPQHQAVADQWLETGRLVLVSEWPPETKTVPEHFPARNRLVAGFSRAIVVTEAAKKSGSLITAQWANDQGKEIFAVPGDIFSPQSAGTHQLLLEGAAHPALCGEQILEHLGLGSSSRAAAKQLSLPRTGIEADILKCFEGGELLHIDELSRRSQIPPHQLTSTLLLMVMRGYVKEVGGQVYAKS